MGVRDLEVWAAEASRKMTLRKIELANAALLPHQSADKIREHCDHLDQALSQIDMGGQDEIAKVEAENRVLMEAQEARAKDILTRRRAAGIGKKKHGPSRKARRLK